MSRVSPGSGCNIAASSSPGAGQTATVVFLANRDSTGEFDVFHEVFRDIPLELRVSTLIV